MTFLSHVRFNPFGELPEGIFTLDYDKRVSLSEIWRKGISTGDVYLRLGFSGKPLHEWGGPGIPGFSHIVLVNDECRVVEVKNVPGWFIEV